MNKERLAQIDPENLCESDIELLLEDTDWCLIEFNAEEHYALLQQFSPLGEDFWFTVQFGNGGLDEFAKDVEENYKSFDPEEHAVMWYQAKDRVSGVPNSIRALLEDADAIDEELQRLDTHVCFMRCEILGARAS